MILYLSTPLRFAQDDIACFSYMKILAKNKKAYHDYDIQQTYDAGIVLAGHEVKSIKTQQVNITHATALFEGKELFLHNMDVPLYRKTAPNLVPNYEPKHKRKLLLNQRELGKISAFMERNRGYLPLPLQIYATKQGRIKIKLGVGKLHKKVEKKQILKEKDIKRQMSKEMKNY